MIKSYILILLLLSSCLESNKVKVYGPEIKKLGYFCAPYYAQGEEIFLGTSPLKDVSKESFQPIRRGLIKDKNGLKLVILDEKYGNYRCAGHAKVKEVLKITSVKSPETFEIIKEIKEGLALAKDKFQYYAVASDSVKVESSIISPKSFRILPNTDFAKDDERVYIISKEPKLIFEWFKRADPSFRPITFVANAVVEKYVNGNTKVVENFLRPTQKQIEQIKKKFSKDQGHHVKVIYRPSNYFKDKKNVFYKSKRLANASLESFMAIQKNLAFDQHSLYAKSYELKNRKGELIHIDSHFAKDQNNLYDLRNHMIIKNVDVSTFKIINQFYSKDKNHVFYGRHGNKIEHSDPATFNIYSEFNNTGYAKDKNAVYYRGQKIMEADLESFHITRPPNGRNSNYAEDKNNRYLYGKAISQKP